jgi:hypothetical protein
MYTSNLYAALKVDGAILAEVINDPWNYGLTPGHGVVDFSKLNVGLKVTDSNVDVFLPISIGINKSSQMFILSDDYLSIPYYYWMKISPFTFSASSRPVGNKFGYVNMEDQLGVWRSLNSLQPSYTMKIQLEPDEANEWNGVAYWIFDQKVEGLPIWERMPSDEGEIGAQIVEGKKISEYGFTDEIAQYSLARLDYNPKSNFEISFLVGTKSVNNPEFRISQDSQAVSILKNADSINDRYTWGYEKRNFGLELMIEPLSSVRVQGSIIGSEVSWRRYLKTRDYIYDPLGSYSWYPSDVRGYFSGNAFRIKTDIAMPNGTVEIDNYYIAPNFQAVAAAHGQFPRINYLDVQSDILVRRVRTIFDPIGDIFGEAPVSSPIVEYLGKRVSNITYSKDGKIGNWSGTLMLNSLLISSIDKAEISYNDPLTNALITKDFNEICANISISEKSESPVIMTALNRDYQVGSDYYRSLALQKRTVLGQYTFFNSIDKAWRLRNDDGFGEGQSFRLINEVDFIPDNSMYLNIRSDYRKGDYDYDLLGFYGDRVVDEYSFSGIQAYLELKRKVSFMSKNIEMVWAGEFIKRLTDLSGVDSGTVLIGYLAGRVPLSKFLTLNTEYITAKGPSGPSTSPFPSANLSTTFHHKLIFNPFKNDDRILKVGYTIRPQIGNEHRQNIYGQFSYKLGQGNCSITYGQATLPKFSKSNVTLFGLIDMDDLGYPNAKALRGRPWEKWDNSELYTIWNNMLRPTDRTWENYVVLRYWIDF